MPLKNIVQSEPIKDCGNDPVNRIDPSGHRYTEKDENRLHGNQNQSIGDKVIQWLQDTISDNSPAVNWIEGLAGRTLITGQNYRILKAG